MAPHFKSALIEAMKSRPYSLAVDDSNGQELKKLIQLLYEIMNLVLERLLLIDFWTCAPLQVKTKKQPLHSNVKFVAVTQIFWHF